MQLLFRCRFCARSFESSHWELVESTGVVEESSGARRLTGLVRVTCPACGRSLAFRPEELACPFSRDGK